MRLLVSGMLSFSCAAVAAAILFLMVTSAFVSLVALWRGVLGTTLWPGPNAGLLYMLLLLLVPMYGAARLGKAIYSRLGPSDSPRARLILGLFLGLAGWLAMATALFKWFWK